MWLKVQFNRERGHPARFQKKRAGPPDLAAASSALIGNAPDGHKGTRARTRQIFVFDTRGAARSLSLLSGLKGDMSPAFVCAKCGKTCPPFFSGEKIIRHSMFTTHGFGQQMPM